MQRPPLYDDLGRDKEKPHSPSLFEIITRLVLPVALAIFAKLKEEQLTTFWALIILAVLSSALGLFDPRGALLRRKTRKLQNALAKSRFAEFCNYVHEFGEFVRPQNSDTLHHILLSEACRNNSGEFRKFSVPEIYLFHNHWHYLTVRLEREKATFENLAHYVSEFGSLIGSYSSDCVYQIFQQLPQDLRTQLTPEIKGNLNLFQQRYTRFLENYQQFLRSIERSLGDGVLSPTHFSLPKPL